MKASEFDKIMQDLKDTFPHRWPESRLAMVFDKVKDVDASWLKKIVTEMVIKGDDRVNLIELIAVKRTSDNMLKKTQETVNQGDKGQWSNGQEYFKKLGYKDFADFLRSKQKLRGMGGV